MKSKEIITKSDQETKKLAGEIAQEILETARKEALVIGLEGDLGSGKTTFIQGVAQGLGIKDKITSPTFVIMKKYNSFYHIDCYRIESNDLLELGFKEIISQPGNIVMIEWAERVKDILPKNTIWIKFEYLYKNKRRITY
ncbi:tRNA (adenosine(37)-N6)-threonylcarbamoyltransferase complex ATPase subunit type 1 TsaE [Patescibacteria group bacterium]|nr:tRNA (adenosine(37)-N6)-threonylcarbamoyltransferase complex ATPase subunit type 1 TsaE [Patescibacteria group bacterium]